MSRYVLIRPEAELDIKEAFSWYEERRQGLGFDFLLQIEAGLSIIGRNPEINPPVYKNTRKFTVKRFPYKIIYMIEKDATIILAVMHEKRNPEFMTERTDPL